MEIPAISVIIPLYNAEKFIGECLNSLLAQTFQNFEVIVVDDCSTDDSAEIVKNYAEKFGERLIFAATKKNSGGPGEPSNIGMGLSHGEYLFFIDNDDTITPDALEKLYRDAKNFDADVVTCEKYLDIDEKIWNDPIARSKIKPYSYQSGNFVEKPILISDDLTKRVQDCSKRRFLWNLWTKLIRREFILTEQIKFVQNMVQDMLVTCCMLCTAKKIVRVPYVINFRRLRNDSVSQKRDTLADYLKKWIQTLITGFDYLEKFLNRRVFFQQNPAMKYTMLKTYVDEIFRGYFAKLYTKFPAYSINELLRKEFADKNSPELTSFVFNAMNFYYLRFIQAQQQNNLLNQRIAMENFPAVSVIIPLYNAESYIAECFDSLLAQTFKNFEIIVVDDCSTDNSAAIVQNYAEKFAGRLIFSRMKVNSGYASLPRNKGIELSRGEYLYFIDPDDTISPTALDELYNLAKKFNADVVHCEKYFSVPDNFYNDAEYRKKLKPYSWPMKNKRFITKPTLLTDDLSRRITDFSSRWLQWAVWAQMVRRKFIIEHEIKFINVYSQDMLFTMCELCCAKRYLVIPNVFYFWREHEGSKVTEKLDLSKTIHKYAAILKHGIKYLDEFLNQQDFFADRADLKYILFDTLAKTVLVRLDEVYLQNPAYKVEKFLREEFSDISPAVSAYLFSAMNIHRLQLMNSRRKIEILKQEVSRLKNKV